MSAADEEGVVWVVAPPGDTNFGLVLRVGDGVELSPAALEALDTLARELAGDDVSGFMRGIGGCGGTFTFCNDGTCSPKMNSPCAALITCRVCLGNS